LVVGGWVVLLAVAISLMVTMLADGLTTAFVFVNTPESQRGVDLAEEMRGLPRSTNEVVIVRSDTLTIDDPAFQQVVTDLTSSLQALGPDIIRQETLFSYLIAPLPFLLSDNRQATIIPFTMAGNFDDATSNIGEVVDVVESATPPAGIEILITGQATVGKDFQEVGQEGIEKGEIFGVPVALIILALVFGTLVAAILPVILAFASIFVALGAAAVVGQFFALSFFVTNIIFMIGLAVGIDYSLFIVARYREERARGLEKIDAIARAGGTASRAVLFSGVTVVIALIGMLLVPFNIFIGLGAGAILVVIASVLSALTLLPASLSILGDGIDRLRIPFVGSGVSAAQSEGGFWDTVSYTVMRRPVISLLVAGGILVAAAVPTLNLSIGFAGVNSMPDGIPSKEGFLVLDQEFSAWSVTPAVLVFEGDVDSQQFKDGLNMLAALLDRDVDSAFGSPQPLETNEAKTIGLLNVPVVGDSAEPLAINAVARLRNDYVPRVFDNVDVNVYVTGETAYNADFFTQTESSVWVVFPFVLGMSFILLMLVFRSIIVPIKAILLNLLSVGATYGVLVLAFQEGWGAKLGVLTQFDIIEAWIPLFLFSILFGLSMDYHVFLMSRIRERYDQSGDNAESVAFGIRTTGRLITGAGLIMVAVFWAFAAGDIVGLQQMGFGLGVAILIDATIVRIVLVPAAMKLLGDWNWYLPSFLDWLPDLRVEAEPIEPVAAPSDD
jgi:RND superfamily putative drug exporter